jgi:hypothetical protein
MRYVIKLLTKEERFTVGAWKRHQYHEAISYAKETAKSCGPDYFIEVKDTYTDSIVTTFNQGETNENKTTD